MEQNKNTSWILLESEGESFQEIVFTNFERDLELESEFGKEWNDPYNSIWLKLATILVFSIEVMLAGIMFAFVYYETTGLAGHYRTVINQLLSFLYGGVSLSTTKKQKWTYLLENSEIFKQANYDKDLGI